jgi:hypothetical protein
MRRRPSWYIALLAAFLNALAPVFAYAIGQPLHELSGGWPGSGARAVPAPTRHAGVHTQHVHGADPGRGAHHAVPANDPAAPHCPYCLDFAAGTALGTSVPVIPAAQPGHSPLPASAPVHVSARPSLRLASPRGPPLAG